MILLLVGCMAQLLPGERVLGDEIPAVVLTGTAGSGFGAAVALGENTAGETRLLVGAPDSGVVSAFDLDGDLVWSIAGSSGLGTRVGWSEGLPWAWGPGAALVVDVQQATSSEANSGATAATVCPDGEVLTREGRGEDIVCTQSGSYWTECVDQDCQVVGSALDGAQTSAGSALGLWDELLCVGNARLGTEEAGGSVRCEDGSEVVGEPGDHLGLAIAGGRVAGVFNRHIRPPRARIVSQRGEHTWVVDRAAELSRISLATDGETYAVGVPGYGAREAREGRVFVLKASP
jgi:hypothetical protein